MGPNSENRLTVSTGAVGAPETALAPAAGESVAGAGIEAAEPVHEGRLDRIGMRLDVMVKVPSFCVRDLLALERGTVVETGHEHTQDVPVRCGGAPLAWAEFEVVNDVLAVRLTRLA
ncbi:MAG: FliM/FliN family flagellar motor C-terminal domain-containing protein [Acidobacteriaceae bacterium]